MDTRTLINEAPAWTVHADVEYWTREIQAAKDREKDYRKEGSEILELYEGKKPSPFNILYSNTETLAPALYSATPIPIVQRRFKDDDPLGKASAQAGQRMLTYFLDTNLNGYETIDECMKAAVLNGLLVGRGETAVKYDAEIQHAPPATEGEEPTPVVQFELVCCESIQWNRVLYGYAKSWVHVPWVAYEQYVDQAEATRLFGKAIADKLVYADADKDDEKKKGEEDEPHQGARKVACLYQIWDRTGGKTVKYFSAQYPSGLLREDEDPLGLTGFFNCPKPLQFLDKSYSRLPTALYTIYKEQAEELNELTRRIKRIARAIKARGIYDSELGSDLKNLMEADDNELVAADKSSSLAAEKGLDNAIWFMPIDKLIVTLRELQAARESCKQVIYEITGISDILRGASKASETLGAQQIKTQWGTLRLKNKQKEVVRYIVDLLRLMLEIAATKFSEETWAKVTGLPFLLSAKYNELTAIAKTLQAQIQRQQMQRQQMQQQMQAQSAPPVPRAAGVPPPPPPPSPLVQQLQQVQHALQAPQWSQVLALLKDDLQRSYRIDIETNSSIEMEAADDHKNITELMTVIGQMLNGLTPLVTSGALPFEAVQSLLLVVARRYRFGSEIEDTIKSMHPPKPPDEGQGQAQQKQAEMQIQMKEMEAGKRIQQQLLAVQLKEMQLKASEEKFALEQQLAQEKLAMRDQVHQVKTGAEQKVKSLQGQSAQRETQLAKQADSQVAQGMTAMQEAIKQVLELSASLESIQRQAASTDQLLGELLKVAKAPLIKRAIRGQDNRIERVVEEMA